MGDTSPGLCRDNERTLQNTELQRAPAKDGLRLRLLPAPIAEAAAAAAAAAGVKFSIWVRVVTSPLSARSKAGSVQYHYTLSQMMGLTCVSRSHSLLKAGGGIPDVRGIESHTPALERGLVFAL